MLNFAKSNKNMKKGKVTIEIEVYYEWVEESGDGFNEPKDGGYYEFDLPSEKELVEKVNKAIEEDY